MWHICHQKSNISFFKENLRRSQPVRNHCSSVCELSLPGSQEEEQAALAVNILLGKHIFFSATYPKRMSWTVLQESSAVRHLWKWQWWHYSWQWSQVSPTPSWLRSSGAKSILGITPLSHRKPGVTPTLHWCSQKALLKRWAGATYEGQGCLMKKTLDFDPEGKEKPLVVEPSILNLIIWDYQDGLSETQRKGTQEELWAEAMGDGNAMGGGDPCYHRAAQVSTSASAHPPSHLCSQQMA
jgi:hypothetical protein